jgi:transcriptional regulator with XRE-family HTH domain
MPAAAMESKFAALIRDRRIGAGLTQRDLAARLGVSQALLSQWEAGLNNPRASKLPAIAEALRIPIATLRAATAERRPAPQQTASDARRALSIEELHAQARAHVMADGPDRLDIWVIGAANLSVMRRADLLERRWRENLLWGFDYSVVWALDLVDEDRFGTVLSLLSELERKVAREHPSWLKNLEPDFVGQPRWLSARRNKRVGRINHYALSILEAPKRATLSLYARFERAQGEGFGRVHPFVAGHDESSAAVSTAARALMRVWHPETGVVLYRPIDGKTPAAANIRLMPVTEEIVTRIAPELEEPNYWFWLSPAGARRLAAAVDGLESAIAETEG